MYERYESEYHRAKIKAAKRVCRGWVKPADLPSNAEIRDQIQMFARLHEGEQRLENLLEMRLEALRMMYLLERFKPRLIGSVFTGHVRRGSDIDLHLFSDNVEPICAILDWEGWRYEVERKRVQKEGESRVFTHIHIRDRFPFELTVYASNKAHYVFKSSITGKAIERASIPQLEQFLLKEYPNLDLEDSLVQIEEKVDRFAVFESLLLPLERVMQSKKYHPEGDALYHSLQVFDLACDELPYDEEFLTAALLHDVGKGLDREDHVGSGLEALEDFITERTYWLIEHHMIAQKILDRTIGARAHKRLKANESYRELVTLAECDQGGRQRGVATSDVDEALDYLRNLDETFGDG